MILREIESIRDRDSDYAGSQSAQGKCVHKVKKDDTLWSIAQRYGLDVSELKDINGLTTDTIIPGTNLLFLRDRGFQG